MHVGPFKFNTFSNLQIDRRQSPSNLEDLFKFSQPKPQCQQLADEELVQLQVDDGQGILYIRDAAQAQDVDIDTFQPWKEWARISSEAIELRQIKPWNFG